VSARVDVWALIADRFEEAYGPKADSPGWPRAQRLAAGVDGPVLDLACGAGYELSLFAHGVGIDSSPGMLAAARKRAPRAGLVLGDVRWLPFRAETFAAAISCFALIHLTKRDLAATLASLRPLLRAGAELEMSFFAGSGEKDTTFSEISGEALAHYSYYQADELAELFAAAGFVGVRVEPGVLHEPAHVIDCLFVSAEVPHQ
jgi:SAM-dependent methyltransferase